MPTIIMNFSQRFVDVEAMLHASELVLLGVNNLVSVGGECHESQV